MAKAKPDLPESLHIQTVAEILTRSTRRIRTMIDEGKLVRQDNGVSVASLAAFISGAESTPTGYEADKARLMKAKADRAEIEAAQKAGKLVLTDRIGAVVDNAIGVAVSKLVQVGDKVAPLCILEKTPGPAAVIINDAIRAACEELHSMDIAAVAVESSEAVEPMSDNDGDSTEGADEDAA